MKKNFFEVPRTHYTTSYTKTQVPMFFYKIACRLINYFVDYDRALSKLMGTGLKPCRFFNGKAMVSLIFFNYQQVSIGGYDEVVITIMVYPEQFSPPIFPFSTILFKKRERGWKNIGGYVLEMPVTSPAARAAGREIWGYPKFLTQIPFKLSGKKFEFSVKEPESGKSIVDVKGEMGPGFSAGAFDLVSLNNYDDTIFRVVTEVDGKVKNCTCKRIEVKAGPTNHRMAQNIRDLGLEGLKPFAIMSSDNLQTRLNPGLPIAKYKTPPMPYAYKHEIEFYEKQKTLLGENSFR